MMPNVVDTNSDSTFELELSYINLAGADQLSMQVVCMLEKLHI